VAAVVNVISAVGSSVRDAGTEFATTQGQHAWRRTALVGLPVAAVALAAWDPAQNGGPPLCPFRACTGIACPGCGVTRAAGALLRGRWGDAVHLQPLMPLFALQVVAVWLAVVLRGRALPEPPAWVIPVVLALNGLALIAVWVVRLGTGSLGVVG
jgi:hypothetical protein